MALILEDGRKVVFVLLNWGVNALVTDVEQRVFLMEKAIVMLRRCNPSADGAYPTTQYASGKHHPEVSQGVQGVLLHHISHSCGIGRLLRYPIIIEHSST